MHLADADASLDQPTEKRKSLVLGLENMDSAKRLRVEELLNSDEDELGDI